MATTQRDTSLDRVPIDTEAAIAMYRAMVLTREADNRIRSLYFQGQIHGGVYSQIGHEAISVGSASALRQDDILAPMHRDLGAHVVRGMDLPRIMAQIMARATGYTGGKDNALHIGDTALHVFPQISMLGASIPVAVGGALAAVQRGQDRVALTYVGDGAINTQDFHEGLNFAAALRLPFILIIENNQWAYSTPLSRQVALEELKDRAVGYGIPGVRVDGNDVLEVYRVTREAVDRARAGDGPTLIEALTMRMRGHSEQDRAEYVPPEMLEEWRARDPIELFERLLTEEGILSSERRDAIATEVRETVTAAADWGLAQPFPTADEAFNGVYRT
jgi:TPP-dependent pyruvate/acetoin dehydrogenase alpha subunit